jgi:hypothetical protein
MSLTASGGAGTWYKQPSLKRSPAMRKLVAATAFAAFALAAQSAVACDWNREASTEQQTVATTAAPTQTPQTTSPTQTVASEAAKPVEPTAPVVLVNDRH